MIRTRIATTKMEKIEKSGQVLDQKRRKKQGGVSVAPLFSS